MAFDPYVIVVNTPVASFDDAIADASMVKMITDVDPVQDLNGYDHPWPAGGGKNIIPPLTAGSTTVSGITYTVNADGTISVEEGGTASADINISVYDTTYVATGSYILSGCPADGSASTYRLNWANHGANDTGSGTPATAHTTGTAGEIRVQIFNGYTIPDGGLEFKPMLCDSAAADPTVFAPYSNICPITGWTGANVYVNDVYDQTGATVYNVDWTGDGTVYKGKLNVLTGVLTVTHAGVDMGDLTWYAGAGFFYSADLRATQKIIDSNADVADMICSAYGVTSLNNLALGKIAQTSGSSTAIRVIDTQYADAAAFKTGVTGQTLVYELATPVEYELTAQDVKTLEDEGMNYVWTDTGNIAELYYPIDVSYFRRFFMLNSGYVMVDLADLDFTDSTSQLIDGSWDAVVAAIETGKPIWVYSSKYGTGKPTSPVPMFGYYSAATSVALLGSIFKITVNNTDYCAVDDLTSN